MCVCVCVCVCVFIAEFIYKCTLFHRLFGSLAIDANAYSHSPSPGCHSAGESPAALLQSTAQVPVMHTYCIVFGSCVHVKNYC